MSGNSFVRHELQRKPFNSISRIWGSHFWIRNLNNPFVICECETSINCEFNVILSFRADQELIYKSPTKSWRKPCYIFGKTIRNPGTKENHFYVIALEWKPTDSPIKPPIRHSLLIITPLTGNISRGNSKSMIFWYINNSDMIQLTIRWEVTFDILLFSTWVGAFVAFDVYAKTIKILNLSNYCSASTTHRDPSQRFR